MINKIVRKDLDLERAINTLSFCQLNIKNNEDELQLLMNAENLLIENIKGLKKNNIENSQLERLSKNLARHREKVEKTQKVIKDLKDLRQKQEAVIAQLQRQLKEKEKYAYIRIEGVPPKPLEDEGDILELLVKVPGHKTLLMMSAGEAKPEDYCFRLTTKVKNKATGKVEDNIEEILISGLYSGSAKVQFNLINARQDFYDLLKQSINF